MVELKMYASLMEDIGDSSPWLFFSLGGNVEGEARELAQQHAAMALELRASKLRQTRNIDNFCRLLERRQV